MKKIFLPLTILLLVFGFLVTKNTFFKSSASGAPPYVIEDLEPPQNLDPLAWLQDWTRPEGPAKVGLQVGHWKNEELPEELDRLIGSTGSEGGGKSEWEVNYEIALLTKELLEEKGITVDILPATVPVDYWADVFVSIHADGSEDYRTTGYKAASPRRDFTNSAKKLVAHIEESYEQATGLTKDDNISRNMTGYYAFAWWRYDHAIHPMTTAAILETGFLTNWSDRQVIVEQPELSAQGLAEGISNYLTEEKLLTQESKIRNF